MSDQTRFRRARSGGSVEVYALALDLVLFFVLFVCLCLHLSYAPFAPQSSFICPLLFPIHF